MDSTIKFNAAQFFFWGGGVSEWGNLSITVPLPAKTFYISLIGTINFYFTCSNYEFYLANNFNTIPEDIHSCLYYLLISIQATFVQTMEEYHNMIVSVLIKNVSLQQI